MSVHSESQQPTINTCKFLHLLTSKNCCFWKRKDPLWLTERHNSSRITESWCNGKKVWDRWIENIWTRTAWDALAEVVKKQLLTRSLIILSSKLLRPKQNPVMLLALQLKAELFFPRGNSCDLKALLGEETGFLHTAPPQSLCISFSKTVTVQIHSLIYDTFHRPPPASEQGLRREYSSYQAWS